MENSVRLSKPVEKHARFAVPDEGAFTWRSVSNDPTPETTMLGSVEHAGLPKTAATITPTEYEDLLVLQGEMAARMVTGELSRSEILELQMIRWAIDRAEAEIYGGALNQLELLARLQEQLASEVQRLVNVAGD